jgi:hypothetical protein
MFALMKKIAKAHAALKPETAEVPVSIIATFQAINSPPRKEEAVSSTNQRIKNAYVIIIRIANQIPLGQNAGGNWRARKALQGAPAW